MKRILMAVGAAAMVVTALSAAPAGATSRVQDRMVKITSTTFLKVACHAKGASISKDGKTVRCPGGQVKRAAPSKKFIVVGEGEHAIVIEVDSNMTPAQYPKTVVSKAEDPRQKLGPPDRKGFWDVPEYEPMGKGGWIYTEPLIVDPETGAITECHVYNDGTRVCITYGSGDEGPPFTLPDPTPPPTTKPTVPPASPPATVKPTTPTTVRPTPKPTLPPKPVQPPHPDPKAPEGFIGRLLGHVI